MNWVLIIITWSYNAVAYVPFDTQATCEAARIKLEAHRSTKYVECFKK